jgi:hypothetical protein
MNLHGNISGEVSVNLGLLGRVDSWVKSGRNVIEAFVSDFIDHLLINQYIL